MRFRVLLFAVLFSAIAIPGTVLAQTIFGSIHGPGNSQVGGAARFFNASGEFYGDAWVDHSGNFQSQPLPNGTYHVLTVHTHEMLDEAWGNLPCINQVCVLSASTPIVITGSDVSGIDFILDPITDGGRISGFVEDDLNIPLHLVGIEIRNSNGEHLQYMRTFPDGYYETTLLASDSYLVQTRDEPSGLGRELYDDFLCLPRSNCNDPVYVATWATPVIVASADKTGIDFELAVPPGGMISGQVSDATASIRLPEIHMVLINAIPEVVDDTFTDILGNYYFSGLADGDYKVLADGVPPGYHWELYGGDHCDDWACDIGTSGDVINVIAQGTVTDLDIDLDFEGTRILGTITRSDSPEPVTSLYGHAGAELTGATGENLDFQPTNLAGQYQFILPGAGSYFVVTSIDHGFFGLITEAWEDVKCFDDCNPLTNGASLIAVAEGATEVADFVLDPGRTISGTLQFDGSPTGESRVKIWDSGGQHIATGWNHGDGNWSTSPLPAGTYYATAQGEPWGMVSQLYDGLPCPQEFCAITSGTPIVISTSDIGGIAFNLSPFSADWTISGSVLGPGSSHVGGAARLFDPFGNFVSDVWTDHLGNFYSEPLANGTYFAITIFTNVMLDEAWDNLPCENQVCDVTATTPIVVDNAHRSDIHFSLEPVTEGGHISGYVKDISDVPLGNVMVEIRNSNGEHLRDFQTGPDGYYQTSLTANDTYYVQTHNEPFGLGSELYDDFPCIPEFLCDEPWFVVANGTPVVVDGGDVTGIDFVLVLPEGGMITGQVTDQLTGKPLPDINLLLLGEHGEYLEDTNSDATGSYYFSGLDDGNYKVYAKNVWEGYTGELYGGDHCEQWQCDLNVAGTIITIAGGATVTDIDIALDYTGTRIFGTVTRSDSGAPVTSQFAHFGIDIFNESNEHIGFATTNIAGQYWFVPPGPGNYFLDISSDQNYHGLVQEVWDDIKCYHDCNPLNLGGTPVPVSQDATAVADFVLDPGKNISGTILYDGINTGGGHVNIWDSGGGFVTSAGNQGDGSWQTPLLPAGTYFVTGRGEQDGMVTELYDNLPCPQDFCDKTTGSPIVLGGSDITGIHFDLAPVSADWTISGSILGPGSSFVGGRVRLFDPSGNSLGAFWTDEAGNFQTGLLGNGVYYAQTIRTDGMLDEAWDNIPCVNRLCDVLSSTPIVIDGADRSGIDFVLEPIVGGGRITGTVSGPDGPLPLVLRLRNREGTILQWIASNSEGFYQSTLLSNDDYLLQTHNEPFGLGREVWFDFLCLPVFVCDDPAYVTAHGTAITVNDADRTDIDFDLDIPPGGFISGKITDADAGIPLLGVPVQLMNEFGHHVAGSGSNEYGDYYFSGLGDGNYKVIAFDVPEGYTWELYGGDHCQDWSCDLNVAGDIINISGGSMHAGQDIYLDYEGTRILGTVTRSDTGAPVWSGDGSFSVLLFNGAGQHIGSSETNPAGTYSFEQLDPGNYYLATENDPIRHDLFNEAWNDVQCTDECNPLLIGGTLIPVAEGSSVVADFVLDPYVIFSSSFE